MSYVLFGSSFLKVKFHRNNHREILKIRSFHVWKKLNLAFLVVLNG
jgi:hypothetical protein